MLALPSLQIIDWAVWPPVASTVSGCAIKHREKDGECSSGVIYKLPFDCGLCYIGQTKRCINERLTEHKRCIKKKDPYSEVSKHLIECRNCVPLWHLTSVELREKDDHKRLIKESLTILGHGNAVNRPSFGLDNELRRFLRLWKVLTFKVYVCRFPGKGDNGSFFSFCMCVTGLGVPVFWWSGSEGSKIREVHDAESVVLVV